MDFKYDLTIGIPTFNRGHYLAEAIESALKQSNIRVEVVVCDNASTDNTPEVVSKYVHLSNFRYIRHKLNLGPSANYNLCLSNASGKYFMILGDDDYLTENYGNVAVNELDKYNGKAIFFGKCVVVDKDKNFKWESSNASYVLDKGAFYTTPFKFDGKRHRHAWFMMCTLAENMIRFGGFLNTEAAQAADDMLLLQMSEEMPIIYNPEAVHFYRVYPTSYGNANVSSMAVSSLQYYIFWVNKMEPTLQMRLPRNQIMDIRSKLKKSLANTYTSRLFHYGPKSFKDRMFLISLYPFKIELYTILLREVFYKLRAVFLKIFSR